MSYADALEGAGYKKEKATTGDKPIFEGVYKATLVEIGEPKEGQFGGVQLYGAFKINETLTGRDSNSQYPEFKDYYGMSPETIGSKRKGLAKLLNGLFSIGIVVDTTSDESLLAGLNAAKGSELYIKGYKQKKMKKNDDGTFSDVEGEFKQGYSFMTEKNALKEVEKAKKGGNPF